MSLNLTESMTISYFGEPWGEPAARHHRIPTPVGVPCADCGTPIVEGDQGNRTRFIACPNDCLHPEYAHRECMLLRVFGHQMGCCACNNFTNIGNARAAAILFWQLHGARFDKM